MFFKCRVFVVFETKPYKISNMMHFSWAKTPFPGQSECFVAVLLTWLYLIRIDDASYLNGYCSLMFLCMSFNVFYKSEKHVFYVFYLQSNIFNIYDLIVCAVEKIHILYSKMCYLWTTKVDMIKFTTIMANCVQNNLWKFRKRILKYTKNNDICLRGSFFIAAHCTHLLRQIIQTYEQNKNDIQPVATICNTLIYYY